MSCYEKCGDKFFMLVKIKYSNKVKWKNIFRARRPKDGNGKDNGNEKTVFIGNGYGNIFTFVWM